MSVLDTFYLLFKNDAPSTTSDVAKLEKQIDSLKEKGKKRSEQENKDLKDSIKRHKELKDEVEGVNRQTDKLVDNLATIAASYLGFSALKAGILNTAEFNRALSIQSKNLGQNTTEIRAYGAAIKQLGGDDGAFRALVETQTLEANKRGLKFDFKKYVQGVRDYIKGMSPEGQRQTLAEQGIPVNQFRFFQMPQDEFDRLIENNRKLTETNEKGYEAAEKFGTELDKLGESQIKFWSKVGEYVLPVLTDIISGLTKFTDLLTKGETATVALGALFAKTMPGGELISQGIVSGYRKYKGMDNPQPAGAAPSKSGAIGGDAMNFWIKQGYTREQAAGIVANEIHESNGNPMARGDSGMAHGLYQWHPDRRAAILKAKNIDVSTASAEDQRRAAAYELESSGLGARLRQIKTADAAGAFFSQNFERPSDPFGQKALQRGQTALGIASSYTPGSGGGNIGGNSSSVSVKIDEVNVNTQATDADGMAHAAANALDKHIRTVVANHDDGEEY